MLGRLILAGVAVAALGASPVLAGGPPVLPVILMAKTCFIKSFSNLTTQCAIQTAKGDRNRAVTNQTTEYSGHGHSLQLGITYQWGNDNNAHTNQIGEDQIALTIQKGNNNHAATYQSGDDQLSITVQKGNGHYAATSSIGSGDDFTLAYQEN